MAPSVKAASKIRAYRKLAVELKKKGQVGGKLRLLFQRKENLPDPPPPKRARMDAPPQPPAPRLSRRIAALREKAQQLDKEHEAEMDGTAVVYSVR